MNLHMYPFFLFLEDNWIWKYIDLSPSNAQPLSRNINEGMHAVRISENTQNSRDTVYQHLYRHDANTHTRARTYTYAHVCKHALRERHTYIYTHTSIYVHHTYPSREALRTRISACALASVSTSWSLSSFSIRFSSDNRNAWSNPCVKSCYVCIINA